MKSSAPIPATPPRPILVVIVFTAFSLLIGGCATTSKPNIQGTPVVEPQPAPAQPTPVEPVSTPVAPLPAKAPTPVAQPLEAPKPAMPASPVQASQSIHIESVPSGAMIVVDGRPIGRAPLDFSIESANNGFFKEPMVIRARFVAQDANGESASLDERLSTLEKIPIAIVFSRDGAQRVIRQY